MWSHCCDEFGEELLVAATPKPRRVGFSALADLDLGLLESIYEVSGPAACILRGSCRRFAQVLPPIQRVRVEDASMLCVQPIRPPNMDPLASGGEHGALGAGRGGEARPTRFPWPQPLHLTVRTLSEPGTCFLEVGRGEVLQRVVALDLREAVLPSPPSLLRDSDSAAFENERREGDSGHHPIFGGPESEDRDAKGDAIFGLAAACPSLQQLQLPRGALCHGPVPSLPPALRPLTSLTSLSLEGNRIGPLGAASLAEGLSGASLLTSLSLGFCGIGQEGAAALSMALYKNPSLQSLNLDSNSLCVRGAATLSVCLAEHQGLTLLDLGCNYIREMGLRALVPVLQANTAMRTLRLGCNDMGWAGIGHLVHALGASTSLETLDLSKNNLGGQGAYAMVPLLRTKNRLSGLQLGSNGISARHVAHIRLALTSECTVQTAC